MRTKEEIELKIAFLIQDCTLDRVAANSVESSMGLMSDIGLDSLDYATVMLGCEKWLGIKINESAVNWREIQTVGQLANLFFRSQKNG